MKKIKKEKKINPHVREIILTLRVNSTEMKDILARAHAYTGGDVSKWMRHATLKHKPKKEDLEWNSITGLINGLLN